MSSETNDVRFRFGAEGVEATKRLIDGVGDSLQKVGKKSAEAASIGAASSWSAVSNELLSVSRSAGLAVLGIGGAATAIGGLVALVTNAANLGAELDDLSQSTGASVENLSRLRDLARATGYDFGAVTTAVSQLNAAIYKAERSENSPAARGLASIGLAAKDLQKLDPAAALKEVASAFAELEDGSAKAAAAQAIFKDPSVLAYLNDLADDTGRAASMTTEQARRATELQDAMSRMSVAAGNAGQAIALEFVPALADIAKFTEEAQSKLGPLLGTLVGTVGGGVLKAFGVELDQLKRTQADAAELFEKRQKIVNELGKARTEKWDPSLIKELERQRDSIGAELRAANSQVAQLQAERASEVKRPSRRVDAEVLGQGAGKKQSQSAIEGFDAGTASAKAYAKAIEDLSKIEIEAANKSEGLTRAQSVLRSVMESPAWDQMWQPWRDIITQQADAASVAERNKVAMTELKKASEEWADERQRAASELDQQLVAQREENETLGISAQAAKELAAAKLDLAAATEAARAATLRENAAYAGGLESDYRAAADALDALAAKRRALAESMRDGALKESGIKAAEESAKAWQRAGEQIEQALTDALMRGFESGKDFGENFIDSLKNTIKTAALRLAVQVVVNGASSGIQSVLGSGDSEQAGSSGGLGQYSSLLSTASSLYGYAGTAASALGAFAGTSAGGTAGGFAAGWSGAGSISSGVSAMGSGYGMSGAGQAIGGVLRYIWPLAIAYGMYMSSKAYDQGFHGDDPKAYGQGDGRFGNITKLVNYDMLGGGIFEKIIGERATNILLGSSLTAQILTTINKKWFGKGGEKVGGESWLGGQVEDFKIMSGADSSLAGTVTDIGKRISDVAALFGGTSSGLKIGLGYDADPQGKANSSVSAAIYGADGKAIYRQTGYDAGRGEGDLSAAIGVQASRLLIAGLKASNIDDAIKGIFNGLDLNTLTEAQANQAVAAASALQAFGTAIVDFYDSLGQGSKVLGTLSNKDQLAGLFGGFDALKQSVGAAYDLLMSDSEKLALAQTNLSKSFADLNLSVPASSDALRSLIEAQDLTTESGRKAYAALIGLTPAFAQITSAADAAAAAAQQAAEQAAAQAAAAQAEQAERMAKLAATRRDLEIQYLDVSGDTAGALAARRADQLAALDESLRPLLKKIFDQQDLSAAAAAAKQAAEAQQQAQAEAANAAAQAAQEQQRAQEQLRQGWQVVSDSIAQTVRDLRGEITPAKGAAQAQAAFALATAAAKAGDQAAAQSLPQLARAVVEAGKQFSTTAEEQSILVARTAASLVGVVDAMGRYGISVPKFESGGLHAGGVRIVGEKGPELEVTGPSRILSNAALTSALRGDSLDTRMRELIAEVASQRDTLRAIAGHTAKTARRIDAVSPDGDAIQTRAAP